MQAPSLKPLVSVVALASFALLPMGCKKAPPITLSCNASAPAVYPGQPLTITATPGSVSTKKHNNVIYEWSGDGVSGNGASATVDTAGLAPGSYTAKVDVKEGKKGKEGRKKGQTAECSAPYTVKPYEPPTISCAADPSTIKPGETSTITSTAVSPQNLPLTYSYSASSGSVTGTGATAEYSSAGAPSGAVGITCNVSDNKGHTVSANTTVTIAQPPPPPAPKTQALCSISFSNDPRRPTRVDNEAKACLDQVAVDLKQQADAKLVIVGEASSKEAARTERQQKYAMHHHHARVEDYAAQRAVNAKNYLVTEQGIDASRISVDTGSTPGKSAEDYLVPQGANFNADVSGTTPVNETEVKPQARHPMAHHHHHHHAAKTAAQ